MKLIWKRKWMRMKISDKAASEINKRHPGGWSVEPGHSMLLAAPDEVNKEKKKTS